MTPETSLAEPASLSHPCILLIAYLFHLNVLQMDVVVSEAFKMVNADDGKLVKEDEFKKLLTEILGSIMLQLEGNPIAISSNSVVHEPLASPSSTLLQPSS